MLACLMNDLLLRSLRCEHKGSHACRWRSHSSVTCREHVTPCHVPQVQISVLMQVIKKGGCQMWGPVGRALVSSLVEKEFMSTKRTLEP